MSTIRSGPPAGGRLPVKIRLMGFFVYAIYNLSVDKLYVGQTSDLERRLREHNLKRGRHFTARFLGSWKLVYSEEVRDRVEAIIREKQLKSFQGRKFLRDRLKL